MEKRITNLCIGGFRGLKNLSIRGLKRVNVLLGDNNSGKTSVLEAIEILKNPSLANVVRVCNQRTEQRKSGFLFTDFIYAFPADEKEKSMELSCQFDSGMDLKFGIRGKVEEVIGVDALPEKKSHVQSLLLQMALSGKDKLVRQFVGDMSLSYGKTEKKENIRFSFVDTILQSFAIPKGDIANVVYLAPTRYASLTKDLLNPIYENEKYKEICIHVLKLFDESIEDVFLLRNEFNQPIDCIRSSKLGVLPISNYGDGLKKVIAIAGAIALANNGILLIDEFETAIHVHNFKDIFNFLDKASRAYNVQLFLTTHSIEAIDELLKVQQAVEEDDIRFITLKKDRESGISMSRILDSKAVLESRESFGFEVRL